MKKKTKRAQKNYERGMKKYEKSLRTIQLPFGRKPIKQRGREFELRVKKDLVNRGYTVSKPKNIHYDWYAKKSGKIYLIECKCKTSRLSTHQLDYLTKQRKKGKIVQVAIKSKTGRIGYHKI